MDALGFHDIAFDYALELPCTTQKEFAKGWQGFYIVDKWFMVASVRDGVPIVNLKAEPDVVRILIDAYECIHPAYHMSKKHWVTITPGKELGSEILQDLILDSYFLVVTSLPKHKQPAAALELINPILRWGKS